MGNREGRGNDGLPGGARGWKPAVRKCPLPHPGRLLSFMQSPIPRRSVLAPMDPKPTTWNLCISVLSLYILVILGIQALGICSPEVTRLIGWLDIGVCAILFVDVVLRWRAAPDQRAFWKWGWMDLLACIPVIEPLRALRLLRVFWVIRVFKALRSMQHLATLVVGRRAQDGATAGILLIVMLLMTSALAVLNFEQEAEGATIKEAGDAIWWAFITITTVGYGDFYPVTPGGRMVAIVLMVSGVGFFGVISGFLAAKMFGTEIKDEEEQLDRLEAKVDELLARLRAAEGGPE